MNNNNVKRDTIIRTIILVIALVNQILTSANKNPLPFSNEEIYAALTAVFTVGAALWNWWKNNSFTKPAIEADNYMKKLKQIEKK